MSLMWAFGIFWGHFRVSFKGGALKPEEIASFLMDREKGGDWRPCLRALAQTQFAKIMDDSLSWNVIFTNDVQAAANITMPDGRKRVIDFLASDSFKEAGSWSEKEADAAERLIERDPRLQRVFLTHEQREELDWREHPKCISRSDPSHCIFHRCSLLLLQWLELKLSATGFAHWFTFDGAGEKISFNAP